AASTSCGSACRTTWRASCATFASTARSRPGRRTIRMPPRPWCSPPGRPASRRARCSTGDGSPRSPMDTGGAWGAGRPQLVATGLSHVGFMTKLAGHLQAGSTMHVLTRWRAGDALRVIARERMPYIGGVAAQVSLLLSVPDFDRYDLRAVQGLIIGAGPSPAALV